jgi:hypothetical protein
MSRSKTEAVRLTKAELASMLDAQIRRSAGWSLRNSVDSLGVQSLDDDVLDKAVNKVYDGIVSDFSYSEQTVKATRAVRFNKAYVRKVIRAGIKDGSIKAEAALMRCADKALKEAELPEGVRYKG